MIWLKLLLVILVIIRKEVASFVKKGFLCNDIKMFLNLKTVPYYRQQKKHYRLFKKKEEDVEKYVPYIYRTVATSLKDLADEEYSYKDLLYAYFPETIEREKKEIEKEKKKKKKVKNITVTVKKEEKKEKHKNVDINTPYKDIDKEETISDSLVIKEKRNNKVDEVNFEYLKNNENYKVHNHLLDDAYKQIENSLNEIYISREKLREKNDEEEEEEDEDKEKTKINYYELAKQEDEMLDKNMLCNYSLMRDKSTFDFFGVFYDHENYKNPKKIMKELEKILNLEPLKSNENTLMEDIEFLLKKKIPPAFKNFLMKYKSIGKKMYMLRNNPEYKKKMKFILEKEEDTDKENCRENESWEKDISEIDSYMKNEKLDEEKIQNHYEEMYRDANKVIMTAHKSLEKENSLKNEYKYLDKLYEIYRKHVKHMHIKNNKLEPQKNNYDFLTFMHEHFDEYNFMNLNKFEYNFDKTKNEAKEKIKQEMLEKKEHFHSILKENKEEKREIELNKKEDFKDNSFYLKKREKEEIQKKYLVKDIRKEYNEQMYDIYKPSNLITDAYSFNSYIDMKKHEKEIDLLFNRYSILHYESKEVAKNNEGFYVGKLIYGKIFEVEKKMAYVDIGYAFYAEIHIDQMPYNINNMKKVFKRKDVLIFEIYKMYNDKILLTLKNIQKINDLNTILYYKTQDIPFTVHVISVLKNGVGVNYNDIFSFIHISALSEKYKIKKVKEDNEEKEERVDESILNTDIKVYCSDIKKLSFSNLLYEQEKQLRNLDIYDVIEATIIHVSKIGLLVKHNDIVGLMHISEVSQKKIGNLKSLFAIGEKVKGVVVNIDFENKRFSLSTKILETGGRNIIEHKELIYKDIANIIEDIKKRQFSLKTNDDNIKKQLLSLMNLYDNEKQERKNDVKQKENEHVVEIKKQEDMNDDMKSIEKKQKEDIKKKESVENIEKEEISDEQMANDNQIEKKEDKINKKGTNEALSIDIHSEMIPYLMLKSEKPKKTEMEEEKKPIVWNLEDTQFVNSNSPSQNSHFLEYQWSFLKEKKWIKFSLYVNRIINYYFSINDDFFTYKEKNVLYEIDFVKNLRTEISSGIYTKIRKTDMK